MRKNILILTVSLLLLLPAMVSGQADTTYLFRFMPQDDIFYELYGGNETELRRLSDFIRANRSAIDEGRIPFYVDGYSNSFPGEAANRSAARNRANRVKSALILGEGLKEVYFRTRLHAGEGDYVTIRVDMPTVVAVAADTALADRIAAAPVSTLTPVGAPAFPEMAEGRILPEMPLPPFEGMGFYLRANLLHWATLTPDLGVEWRFAPEWGVAVTGFWTTWSWNDKDRRYAHWEVSPEVRRYLGMAKCGYIGLMYQAGGFNIKLGATGKQGDYQGGGITGGYRLALASALSLDFQAGLGLIRASYDKYRVIDGVRVIGLHETKNYWGINRLGVTLGWKFTN